MPEEYTLTEAAAITGLKYEKLKVDSRRGLLPTEVRLKGNNLTFTTQNLEEEATGYPGPTPDEIAARNKALLIGTITVFVFLIVIIVGVILFSKNNWTSLKL